MRCELRTALQPCCYSFLTRTDPCLAGLFSVLANNWLTPNSPVTLWRRPRALQGLSTTHFAAGRPWLPAHQLCPYGQRLEDVRHPLKIGDPTADIIDTTSYCPTWRPIAPRCLGDRGDGCLSPQLPLGTTAQSLYVLHDGTINPVSLLNALLLRQRQIHGSPAFELEHLLRPSSGQPARWPERWCRWLRQKGNGATNDFNEGVGIMAGRESLSVAINSHTLLKSVRPEQFPRRPHLAALDVAYVDHRIGG